MLAHSSGGRRGRGRERPEHVLLRQPPTGTPSSWQHSCQRPLHRRKGKRKRMAETVLSPSVPCIASSTQGRTADPTDSHPAPGPLRPSRVGKQGADPPVGGGLCWRGDTGMRGELDRGDEVSSYAPCPAMRLCTVCLSLDGRRTLRWRKLGFWMVAEPVQLS